MIALILHPTEELLIANEQKKILHLINSASVNQAKLQQHDNSHDTHIYIPEYPLWILFDNENNANNFSANTKTEEDEFFTSNSTRDSTSEAEKIFDNNLFKNKNETLKTLRKKLQPLQIYNWKESCGKLFFPVELPYIADATDDTETKKLYGKITFGKMLHATGSQHEHQASFSPSTITATNSDIFLRCKIFRIARAEICVSAQGGKTWQVQQSVWVKT